MAVLIEIARQRVRKDKRGSSGSNDDVEVFRSCDPLIVFPSLLKEIATKMYALTAPGINARALAWEESTGTCRIRFLIALEMVKRDPRTRQWCELTYNFAFSLWPPLLDPRRAPTIHLR